MLNCKKFFSRKTITLIIASVLILGTLIALTASGAVHNSLDCPDCEPNADGVYCTTCIDSGEVETTVPYTCPDCGGKGKVDVGTRYEADCETCESAGVLNSFTCPDCCGTCGGEHVVNGSIWALVPPIIAIGLALITKEVFSSLFIGILSGGILAADFAPLGTVDLVINKGLISAVSGTAGIFVFLIELGILVSLVNKAGGSRAFGEWAKTHIKSKAGAAICTFVLGVLIFIDDYFNCLTVGSVMRPITDKHKISRSKLAYLIDATAAPICMIAPISSWAAAVSQYAADGQGLNLFIAAIPFNFYSLLTLVFIIALVLMKADFGLMKQHEINAEKGDLFSGARVKGEEELPNSKGKVLDLILPIVFLLVFSVFALVYCGGLLDGLTFIDAFAKTNATVALPWGGLIALIATIIYLAIRNVVSVKEAMLALPKGFIAMVPAIFILTFATALKNMTTELGASYYVGDIMRSFPETLQKLLPAVIFLVACLLAFASGTSWGTFGILIPIVKAMFPEADQYQLMVIGISACLAGAVCGDHCSPISDTTIMSSAGAECEHLNHVSTQLPYALFVAVISFVCFVVAGFIQNALIVLPIGIALVVGALYVIKRLENKKEKCACCDEPKE